MMGLVLAGLAAGTLAPSGVSAADEPKTAPSRIKGSVAQKLVREGALLVDVRTPAEYQSGHLERAVNIPFDELAARQSELGGKDTPVVLYCRSGRRTALGARTLQEQGFTKVYDLGPISAW